MREMGHLSNLSDGGGVFGDASLQLLSYLGAVLAGTGALVGSVITVRSNKHTSRADAADMITSAAERVSRLNVTLDRENRVLRKNLMEFADLADGFLDKKVSEDVLLSGIRQIRSDYG